MRLYNNGAAPLQGGGLTLAGDEWVPAWSGPDTLDLAPGGILLTAAELSFPENYQDRLVSLQLSCVGPAGQDQLRRRLHVPAAPFSNEGLTLDVDSLSSAGFPQVELFFRARVEETGRLLSDLGPENIWLSDDGAPVSAFTLEETETQLLDLVFVLDVTGSMSGEIAGVRNHVIEFADSLVEQGVDFRLGMVTFLDEVENVYPFTDDATLFQTWVAEQYAHGGGDGPENSLQALATAAGMQWRDQASRVFPARQPQSLQPEHHPDPFQPGAPGGGVARVQPAGATGAGPRLRGRTGVDPLCLVRPGRRRQAALQRALRLRSAPARR